MKLQKRFMSLFLVLSLCLTMFGIHSNVSAANIPNTRDLHPEDIVVLYDNDVHCAVDEYAVMAGLKAQMKEVTDKVAVVSSGDYIQGDVIGSISKGKYIIDIMNQVGYDVVTLGNHEFDYRIFTLRKLAKSLTADITSCNFVSTSAKKPVFQPYVIKTYGEKKVAFVGITTPESITSSTPAYFMNEMGKFAYDFCNDETGEALYTCVQNAVEAAKAAGADYVVGLSHLGIEGAAEKWLAQTVIANTSGIDVMLDGHSHSTIPCESVKNKLGKEVLLSSTGTKFENIGKLVIHEDGRMTTDLIAVKDAGVSDQAVSDYIAGIKKSYDEIVSEKMGSTTVDLTIMNPETKKRAVRSAETNMGDFVADAIRYAMGGDIGIVNGGGVRADVKAGDITYGDLILVSPYNNMLCLCEATGQQIKDALELSASSYPNENGGFLQVSGLKYTINSKIESSVKLDDFGLFVGVEGEYRVSDIKVLDSESGTYEPIDLAKTYKLAGINYIMTGNGNGYNMFNNNVYLKKDAMLDNESLRLYLSDGLNGVIGEQYKNPEGDGRITIK